MQLTLVKFGCFQLAFNHLSTMALFGTWATPSSWCILSHPLKSSLVGILQTNKLVLELSSGTSTSCHCSNSSVCSKKMWMMCSVSNSCCSKEFKSNTRRWFGYLSVLVLFNVTLGTHSPKCCADIVLELNLIFTMRSPAWWYLIDKEFIWMQCSHFS